MGVSDMENYKYLVPPPPPQPMFSYPHRKRLGQSRSQNREFCCASTAGSDSMDRLFDEGYRADVLIHTDSGGLIYAHANILGVASPVFRSILVKSKCRNKARRRSISIRGVPAETVQIFVRYLYSSRYEEDKLDGYALQLLVLSHAYAIPHLKNLCERWVENRLLNTENAVDIFQLAMLCDAARLSLICHRFILRNIKPVTVTDGWKSMKESHPILERQILESIIHEELLRKDSIRKMNERKIYEHLYEAMEAVVHIFREGCRTIGPHDKAPKEDESPCRYSMACKGLEALVRHFAGCVKRVQGGCVHCKRMWRVLELHSQVCADSDMCRVPLCRKFKQKRRTESKKDDVKWRILVRKILRSKSISGGLFFSFESS